MRNWPQLVHECLQLNQLDHQTSKAVVTELASHLEETYQTLCSRGFDEQAAFQLALQEVDDWRVLAANIRRAKEVPMNHRTKSLWLPALITLFGASVSLAITQFLRLQPHLVWVGGWGMTFYWQWLASLPLVGALGTYLSRRGDGGTQARLAAGLSPALTMLVVMSLLLPWGLAIDGFHFFQLVGFGLGLVNWVAIPAAALLLGTAPVAVGNGWSQQLKA